MARLHGGQFFHAFQRGTADKGQTAFTVLINDTGNGEGAVASGERRLPSWTTRPSGVPSASAPKNPPLTPATPGALPHGLVQGAVPGNPDAPFIPNQKTVRAGLEKIDVQLVPHGQEAVFSGEHAVFRLNSAAEE